MNWFESSDDESNSGDRRDSLQDNDNLDEQPVDTHQTQGEDIASSSQNKTHAGRGELKAENQDDATIPPPKPLENFLTNYPQWERGIQDIRPPFTVYIGNLSFRINTSESLASTIEELVDFRYNSQRRVRVVASRLGIDKETRRQKGFGYIEFDSVEELTTVLNLNDGHSYIDGRQIRLDLSQSGRQNNNRRSISNNNLYPTLNPNGEKYADIDGTKFRGGKYARNISAPSLSSSSTSLSRNTSLASDTSSSVPATISSMGEAITAPSGTKQRLSLKLAPRSVPIGNASVAAFDGKTNSKVIGGSSSNIFGGAKPRDENLWQSSKSTTQPDVISTSINVDKEKTSDFNESKTTVMIQQDVVAKEETREGHLFDDAYDGTTVNAAVMPPSSVDVTPPSDTSRMKRDKRRNHNRNSVEGSSGDRRSGPTRTVSGGTSIHEKTPFSDGYVERRGAHMNKGGVLKTGKQSKLSDNRLKENEDEKRFAHGDDEWDKAPVSSQRTTKTTTVASVPSKFPAESKAPAVKLSNAFAALTADDSDSD